MMKQVYLLTGQPGTGKTSLIKAAIAVMGKQAGGFYTEEIRTERIRHGFRLVTLDGSSATLAHTGVKSPYRVGKYGVDIDVLEELGVSALMQAVSRGELVVIDEIGKMELFSNRFKQATLTAIESGRRVLGTIMLSANPWADAVKRRPEVELIPVTRANNRRVLEEIRNWLKARDRDKD
jgi:nucleoside-triphosphatase